MRLAGALAAVSVLTLAACTSTTSGHRTAASSNPAPSSTAPLSSASSAPTGAATAHTALLTGSDLGPGFVRQAFPAGIGPNTVSPCLPPGSPPLDSTYPPTARAQVGFGSTAPQVVFGEQVSLYHDAAAAQGVMSYGRRALSCKSATVRGQHVQIRADAPTRQVGGEQVDSAQTWHLDVGPAVASIVAVRLGNAVISMEFVALSGTDVNKPRDPESIVGLAVKRAKAALS